ncbi:MAG TPA: orotidine-5'-phosphate decarboxylase [Clostridiaceae bacterium]|nr:orotidine-5'-phosphate decarboxylase [Clostridiaceae bacterium]
MNNFADRLQRRIDELENPSCLGLDPLLSYLPESWQKGLDFHNDSDIYLGLRNYCFSLIEAVADIIPAIKPQMAYFEQYGVAGISALRDIIAKAKELGMLVILDGKRNDIGSTASAYSNAYLAETSLAADALTVNAYLGSDGIRPFLEKCRENDKGIFILCRTSNPSAGELQDLKLTDGRLVYEAKADLIAAWGEDLVGEEGISSVGAVVGATWPQQAKELRERMPRSFFLIPGFGAQGGTAADAVSGFDNNGRAAIVNASRSLMQAWKKQGVKDEDFADACRAEAIAMRDSLREALAL